MPEPKRVAKSISRTSPRIRLNQGEKSDDTGGAADVFGPRLMQCFPKRQKKLDIMEQFVIILCLIQTVCRAQRNEHPKLRHYPINHFKEAQLGEPQICPQKGKTKTRFKGFETKGTKPG